MGLRKRNQARAQSSKGKKGTIRGLVSVECQHVSYSKEPSTTSRQTGVRLARVDCFVAVGPSCQLLEEQLCHGPCHSHGRPFAAACIRARGQLAVAGRRAVVVARNARRASRPRAATWLERRGGWRAQSGRRRQLRQAAGSEGATRKAPRPCRRDGDLPALMFREAAD